MTNTNLERVVYAAEKPVARLVLAHGAGAGNRHEFMDKFSLLLANLGVEVISFNFPYMQKAYELDKKRPPNPNKVLVEHFKTEIERTDNALPLFIAGKSMGGRVATQILGTDTVNKVKGCVVLGYPFIPPGKPEKLTERMAHFKDITLPALILQGERDTFGGLKLLEQIQLPSIFQLTWVKSGDHSFKPLKSSGLTEDNNIQFAAEQTITFIKNNI